MSVTDVSSDLSLHGLIGGGSAPAPAAPEWTRPSEWPDIESLIGPTDDKIVALLAVWKSTTSSDGSAVAFTITTTSGTYSVDWGDGTSDTGVASGVKVQHLYDHTDTDLTDTSYGYKTATITITADSGNLASWTLTSTYTGYNSTSWSGVGWLDIDLRCPEMTSINSSNNPGTQGPYIWNVRESKIQNFQTNRMFQTNPVLRVVKTLKSSVTVVSLAECFNGCYSLQKIEDINFSSTGPLTNMFNSCHSLTSIGISNWSHSSTTDTSSMFSGCVSLTSIPSYFLSLLSTATSGSQASLFNTNHSLKRIDSLTLSSAANSYATSFDNCSSLEYVGSLTATAPNASLQAMLTACYALKEIGTLSFATTGSMQANSLFANCYSLYKIGSINLERVTALPSAFSFCRSLNELPALNTSNCTVFGASSTSGAFYFCSSLTKVELDFSAVTTTDAVRGIFRLCRSLKHVKINNTPGSYTVGTSYTANFDNCNSLERVEGMIWPNTSIALTACYMLGADALDEIFGQLPTVTGTKNFDISACRGKTACNTAIATGKGWTVIT